MAPAESVGGVSDRPVVLEAITDPDVPLHMTLEQPRSFGKALLERDPHEAGISKQAVTHMFPDVAEKLGAK